MVCYITVALPLSARTSWVLRDESRANLNKIASVDKDGVKITQRRVSTVFHNTTYNKRKWGEIWKKTNYTPGNFPQGDVTQGIQKPWCPLGGGKKVIISPCFWTGCWHHISIVLWLDRPCMTGRVGVITGVMGQRCFCPLSCSLSLGRGGKGMNPSIQSSPRYFNCIPHTYTHRHTSLFSNFSASITGDKITMTHNYNEKAG